MMFKFMFIINNVVQPKQGLVGFINFVFVCKIFKTALSEKTSTNF